MRGLIAAFWILDPIYDAMGRVLAFFYSVIASYGVAIALLTVTVRVFLIPLTAKQVKSQQAMQRIQPELKRLQAKHKNDRQKLNEEMMKFYKENKVNPLAGCLPILLQAPLFIVLYRLILDLSHEDGPKHVPRDSTLFTSLVESGGDMISWGIDLSKAATSVGGSKALLYYALIALTVATGYFQQRQMTARLPKDAINPQMQMITKVFPAIIGVVSLSVPAGVVVYFIVSNLWQIGQQAVTFRAFPPPHLAAGADKVDTAKSDKSDKVVKGASGGKATRSPGGKGKGGGGSGGRSSGRTTPPSERNAKKAPPRQTGRQQPKGKRPPPSPRPKGLPPPGSTPGGPTGSGPNGKASGNTNGNGTSAKKSRRKES
ncbi:MAG TPA: YidC/Oxa1 family membrane protein insertase [Acidimicrobiales bacterium]|nr:YidC/Oxa1 family membrane protein insertase [Acidimicrobiales bacterium]